jgi:hypothetical protein
MQDKWWWWEGPNNDRGFDWHTLNNVYIGSGWTWTKSSSTKWVIRCRKSRIYIVERMRISFFLALSHVTRFYATTEQTLIYSFWNALRIRRKINQLHQSSCYTSSIYYTTQNNPWICRYRFNGKVFLIFFLYHKSKDRNTTTKKEK